MSFAQSAIHLTPVAVCVNQELAIWAMSVALLALWACFLYLLSNFLKKALADSVRASDAEFARIVADQEAPGAEKGADVVGPSARGS